MAGGRRRSTRATAGPSSECPTPLEGPQSQSSSSSKCLATADIMLHIQDFLEPLDIMNLRQTSKTLGGFTRHRVVWLHAVANVCAAEGIPVHWFPTESMSTSDLEHLARGPARFLAFMKREANNTISPARTQAFVPKSPFAPGESLKIEQMYLLPGGRFLLSNSQQGMCLWDLGYNAAQPAKHRPVAWHNMTLHSYLEEPQPTADGKGVVMFCTPKYPRAERQRFIVYEIYPASEEPKFELKTEVVIGDVDEWNPLEDSCGMIGRYIVFQTSVGNDPDRYMLNVWDWRDSKGTKWEISGPTNFTLIGETLMTLEVDTDDQYQLVVFDLPEMQPIVSGWQDVTATTNPSKLVLNRRHRTSLEFGILQAFSWLKSTPYVCLVDSGNTRFLPDDTNECTSDNLYAELYMLKPLATGDLTLPSRIPVYQGSCQNFIGPKWNNNLPKHPATTLLWSGQNHVFIRTTPHLDKERRLAITAIPLPPPQSRHPSTLDANTIFLNPSNCDSGPDYMTACFATGRFALLAQSSFDSKEVEIRVADTLLPPSCV